MDITGQPTAVAGAPGAAVVPRPKLDDVMIAMDVVDTLRHDERIAERELNEGERSQALIERLREIYKSQGIEVPDRILEEGVRALAEDRFVYQPPRDSFWRRLAVLYVTRWQWARWGAIGASTVVVALAGYWIGVARPQQLASIERQEELSTRLPQAIQRLSQSIATEAREQGLPERAADIARSGLNAATAGDLARARAERDRLQAMLSELRLEYTIRIVSRRGELTGLWRIPRANPDTYNYYLVVEAIGPDGKVVPLSILNEETGKPETVSTWAVRVPREVLTQVEADKKDDGIVQNAVVGTKPRGSTQRQWAIQTAGGMITRW